MILAHPATKLLCFSTEGKLIDSYTVPYDVHFFHKNYAQQDPEDWWGAVCKATREIVKQIDPEEVLAISFFLADAGLHCRG